MPTPRKTSRMVAVLVSSFCSGAMAAAQEAQPAPPVPQPLTEKAPPQAQTPEPAIAPSPRGRQAAEEEIVVTGSRIRRKDLTTPAPVTVLSREQVLASGKVSIGDFLQSLPEQGNAVNASVNNGSTGNGSTRINLRGLGIARTLVLINGKRMVTGGPGADSAVDLSSIPTASIERVEILKDGASAIYGSDAIAGVVNIITRKRYNGTELSAFGQTTTHGDGVTYDLNFMTGTASDRGGIVFSGGFYKANAIWAGDRDFSRIPVAFDATKGLVVTQGSGTIPQGRFRISATAKGRPVPNPNNDPKIAQYNQLVTTFNNDRDFILCAAGESGCVAGWRPYRGSALATDVPPGDGYNFQPSNYLVTPQQRISLYASGDAKLAANVRSYFDASYVNRQSEQKLAPEPLITGPTGEKVPVAASNFYNPFGVVVTDVRRRLLEFNNRIFDQDIDTFHAVAGLDGTLPELKNWFWDVSLNYGRTQSASLKTGNLRLPKLKDALGPTWTDAAGVVHCGKDSASDIPGCVPLDLFHGPGSITPDQVTGLTYTGNQRGFNQMTSLQANTSGDLFALLSDRPVALAAGYEYRHVLGANIPDPITVAGETSGNKIAITSGGYHVNEGYAELSVPVLSNREYAQQVEASAAVRVFNYSTFGSDYTYKFGGRWQVVPDLILRGTYSTAFRAPSVQDLFQGLADAFPPASDPCRGIDPSTNRPRPIDPNSPLGKNCGAAINNGDSSTQLRAQVGGVPTLQPETARIFTAGVVIEPRMIKNFSLTVDYYNFRIYRSITPIGAAVILQSCYPTSAGVAPSLCERIQRDPSTQQLNNIINTTTNIGFDKTDGIDIALRYTLARPYGRFGVIFDGTWLHRFDRNFSPAITIAGRGAYDLGGGLGGIYPPWKFNAGTTYSYGGFGAGITSRFVGKYKECGDDTGLLNGGGLCYTASHIGQRTVHPYVTWDLFLSYNFVNPVGTTTVSAGVLNVFDRDPAVIYNGFLATSDPTAYDFVGRRVYLRAAQAF